MRITQPGEFGLVNADEFTAFSDRVVPAGCVIVEVLDLLSGPLAFSDVLSCAANLGDLIVGIPDGFASRGDPSGRSIRTDQLEIKLVGHAGLHRPIHRRL